MGCWYETCGLSGLPIPSRTKALLFLLGPGRDYDEAAGGYCYPIGYWQPVAPPLRGRYNDDRGTLDLDKTPPAHWAYTKEFLDENHLKWFDDRYAKEPMPLTAEYDYESFFSKVERGWVTGTSSTFGYHNREKGYGFPLGQMLVREDIWNYFLTLKIEGFGATTQEMNRKAAREYVEYAVNNPPKDLRDSFKIESVFRRRDPRTPFHWTMFEHQEAGAQGGLFRIRVTQDIFDGKINPDAALQIFYDFADLSHVVRMMSHLRRSFHPQTGKGSQDIDWDLHEALAREVARIAKHEDERDYEDDED